MSQLLIQIGVGAILITSATAVQVLTIAAMMRTVDRIATMVDRLRAVRSALVIAAAALWMIFGQLLGVWIWAGAMRALGAFGIFEESLYFALSAYTTLGFGDVLPPPQWRILGALIGANGMLGFGLATAALVEFIGQVEAHRK